MRNDVRLKILDTPGPASLSQVRDHLAVHRIPTTLFFEFVDTPTCTGFEGRRQRLSMMAIADDGCPAVYAANGERLMRRKRRSEAGGATGIGSPVMIRCGWGVMRPARVVKLTTITTP